MKGRMLNMKRDKKHLLADDIIQLDNITFTNVGVVKTVALPSYCEPNTSIANGFVKVFDNDGEELQEIAMNEIDSLISIGKFAVDSTNTIYFVVDKTVVTILDQAKTIFQYYDVVFQLKESVKIVEGQYLLTVYDKLQDKYIYKSIPCDKIKQQTLVDTLLANMDLSAMGILRFEVEPLITE